MCSHAEDCLSIAFPASSFLTRTCLVTVGLVTHASRPGSTRWKSLEFDWDNLLELWLDTQIIASNDLLRGMFMKTQTIIAETKCHYAKSLNFSC